MKKFLYLLIGIFLTTNLAFSADMRFIQVDSAMVSSKDEASIGKHKKLIENINKEKNVEFIIFTGDNIAKADSENLDCFLTLNKSLQKPYYVVLGSKDVNKQKHLGKKDYMQMVSKKSKSHKRIKNPNYTIEKKEIVFIILDGSRDVIPSAMGYYKEDTLSWLENQLSYYNDKNVVIIQHFPLIPPAKKESRCTCKPEEYLNLLKNYKNVKAIFAGNFGINSEKLIEDVLHITTTNAPQYRIIDIMDYEKENPTFWSVIKE
ncbi:MAG: hypothetical protein E7Z92_01385 [Cyanobacteria bacterium SIG31]|nr:hypothetical protein [Cyanobacteria bacterium SIG31]